MHDLNVVVGFLVLVGLLVGFLVARIQHESASRERAIPGRSVTRFKAISHPGLGDDVGRSVLLGFELLSQVSDEYPQVFRLFGAVWAPDRPK